MVTKNRKKLGDLLVEVGVINEEQLYDALAGQKESGLRLGDQLLKMALLTEQQLIEVLEFQLGIPHVKLFKEKIDQSLLNIISEDVARANQILPLRKQGDKLIVAMSDPLDYYAVDDLRLSTGFLIEPVIAKKQELKLTINRYYGMQKSINQMMKDAPEEEQESLLMGEGPNFDLSPVAQMVNQLINQAVQLGASDIHIDPLEEETIIRVRVDGSLRTERTIPKHMHPMICSRIKILARLNIAEKRLSQDGRFEVEVDYRKIDLRVSTLPTSFGEKMVLRVLDLSNAVLETEKLGFSEKNLEHYNKLLNNPYGIILVTGPTGSGKTTTLYSALRELNTEAVNIITVEDPIEYQIKGINQVQINASIGLSFASGLRSIVRQDPDIIMVGEVRDLETAKISLQAAMTGHLVLSTLHTNDAISVVTRLVDMGVESFLVSAAIVGVIAQRLVRKNCSECKQKYTLNAEEKGLLLKHDLEVDHVLKGTGCSTCQNTGYKGRIALHEIMVIDDPLREMMAQKASHAEFRSYLQQKQFDSLFVDGLRKISEGVTTFDEVFRVSIDS